MNKDRARSPPRRLAADSRLEYPRDRESGQAYRGHDRDDYRRRTSRSSPNRGRDTYKDRDREGYRSASDNRSRTRSPRRGQSHMGQMSREVMMDGLPIDMTEEHVSCKNQCAGQADPRDQVFGYLRCRRQMMTIRSCVHRLRLNSVMPITLTVWKISESFVTDRRVCESGMQS